MKRLISLPIALLLVFVNQFYVDLDIALATSIHIPGTPPKLKLVVKSVEVDAGLRVVEAQERSSFCPCYDIWTANQSGQLTLDHGVEVEKQSTALRVSRMGQFLVEDATRSWYYPAIWLESESDGIEICPTGGFYTECSKTMAGFIDFVDLEISRTREIYERFYRHYSDTGQILILPDWRVKGSLVGVKGDLNKRIGSYTIVGNFEFTPPDEVYLEWERQRPLMHLPSRSWYEVLQVVIMASVGFLCILLVVFKLRAHLHKKINVTKS